MENTLFSKQIRSRGPLCCGSRAALVFESELPAGDTPLACHLREVAQTLCAHAEREHLPVAAAALTQLSGMGRGYDFSPHRIQFCASVQKQRGSLRVSLSLRHTVGDEVRMAQEAREVWCAAGIYRLK